MLLVLCLLAGSGCERNNEQTQSAPPAAPPIEAPAQPRPDMADYVFLNGYVYTADPQGTIAQALAVRDDRIIFVGTNAEARSYVGEDTQVLGLDGKMLMPGLHDLHIHLLGLAPPRECDLESMPLSLATISRQVADCLQEFPLIDGWLVVNQWNFTEGNAADGGFDSIRAALDAVSPTVPIFLRGNDGHHAAVNSAALARARRNDDKVVGLSRKTIDRYYARFRNYIGTDAAGEPNGYLSEGARLLVDPPDVWGFSGTDPRQLPVIAGILARNGITSVLDAAMRPQALSLFEELANNGEMHFRLTAAQYPDLRPFTDRTTGRVDMDRVVASLQETRERFRTHPLIKATVAKIFVDGVLEGNPLADPPTLPNAAVLQPYRQARFSLNASSGVLEPAGYVRTDSALCEQVRTHPERYDAVADVEKFRSENGFHPGQCIISHGILEHDEAFIANYMRALYEAGFIIHAHAIGDRAVRVTVANLSALRDELGNDGLPHTIAHAQLVHPDEQEKIGELGLFVAFTYAWATPAYEYDISVIPFISRVRNAADLYNPHSYAMRNLYPARSIKKAGGILVAGSDAPVDSRDPRPFVNIAAATGRINSDGQALNADEAISIQDAITAYTRNGALALQQQGRTGQLKPGYKADLIVISQNIVALAEAGEGTRIAQTQVLTTMFDGKIVYQSF